uniref:Pipecolic acid oxidase n=1 Tax=Cyprinus carpio TaxID=7962 RepID=A0A8C2KMF3_CYPCA
NKQKTLLLEQFFFRPLQRERSWPDQLIRKTYEEDFFIQMMQESYELWAQLEREAGAHRPVDYGPRERRGFLTPKGHDAKAQVPTVFLEKQELSHHIPNVTLTDGNGALIDTHAGVLYADRRVFQSSGGVIKDGEKVIDITPGVAWGSLVITAGPWANTLLTHTGLQLPLKVVKINVCYWKEKIPGTYSVSQWEYDIYGLLSNEYPGLIKESNRRDTKPDERDKQTDRGNIDILVRYVTGCLPGLVPVPAVMKSCMYMVTPDHNFVLDSHPIYGNIIISAGFSGHGFKFDPIIGKLLSQLAMGQAPSKDL